MQAEQEPKDSTTQLSVQDRSTEFVPTSGGKETTSAEALLLAAYILMWALVFGFIFRTARRQLGLDRRLGDIERALRVIDEKDGGGGAGSSSSAHAEN